MTGQLPAATQGSQGPALGRRGAVLCGTWAQTEQVGPPGKTRSALLVRGGGWSPRSPATTLTITGNAGVLHMQGLRGHLRINNKRHHPLGLDAGQRSVLGSGH